MKMATGPGRAYVVGNGKELRGLLQYYVLACSAELMATGKKGIEVGNEVQRASLICET